MTSPPRTATPACLVIRWAGDLSSASGPAQLLRRMIEDQLPATWGVETVDHARALDDAARLVECGLLIREASESFTCDQIIDGIHRFDAAGREVTTICTVGELPRGQFERQVAQQGVRSIVAAGPATGPAGIRSLPFGLCQLTPQGTLPSRRRWFRRVGGVPQDFFASAAGPILASIDLAAVGSPGGSGWRELEKTLDQAATAADQGAIQLCTVADLAAFWAQQIGKRPHRSILRAA
jgi:hypothetical protein